MSEQQAEAAFKQCSKKIISVMGKKETTGQQLQDMAKQLFGHRFIGIFAQNEIPLGRSGMLIANTDISSEPGTHWVALLLTPKTVYIYDSFGRSATKLMKILTKNAIAKKIKIVNSDLSDKEQKEASAICGQLSISWLVVVKLLGIRTALKI